MNRHGGKIHKCNHGANHLPKGSFLQYRTRNCHLSGPAEFHKEGLFQVPVQRQVVGTDHFLYAESLLVAQTMEAGMKEELKKRHSYNKTKELFTFDDDLAERQSAFSVQARPLLAALTALDNSGGKDEDEGPAAIKDALEGALVLLGNANFRLYAWRQKHSSSPKLVNVLCGKVSQRTSTFSRISSMQRSRVNMTLAQLTASLSAHQPPNPSPKDKT